MDSKTLVILEKQDLESLFKQWAKKLDNSSNVKSELPDVLLKIEDVCNLLKVSKVTIHKWKKEGKIPYHRISSRIFFKRSEVLSSLKSDDLSKWKGRNK